MRRRAKLSVIWALASAAAAVLAGRAAATDAKPAGLELGPCPFPAAGEARCGVFRVPENRARPDGRILSLRVVILPALSKTPLPAPLVYLSGGPGQAATDGAPYLAAAPERQDHTIVLLDFRGTGEGNRLDCPPVASDADLQGFMEPPMSGAARFRVCRARLEQGADLTQYTTPIAMRDLDELRAALGYDKLDLMGGSYGTRAALAYIHAYASHVRAAYLSGLSAFANRSPLYHAAAAQRAFDKVVGQCEAEPACHAAYPDVRGDLAAVLDRLRRRPAKVTVRHPATGAAGEVNLSAGAFAEGLRTTLYSAEDGRRIPLLLRRARAGDYAPFAQAALQNSYGLEHALRIGLLLSVSCPEDVARIRPQDVERETRGTFLGDRRVRDQMAACAAWPRSAMPDGYFAPFTSDVPVLLVSGDLDPVTPPSWAEEFRRYLPNSLSLVGPGAHVAGSPCLDGISAAFFRNASVKALDTSCLTADRNPPFVLPSDPAAAKP